MLPEDPPVAHRRIPGRSTISELAAVVLLWSSGVLDRRRGRELAGVLAAALAVDRPGSPGSSIDVAAAHRRIRSSYSPASWPRILAVDRRDPRELEDAGLAAADVVGRPPARAPVRISAAAVDRRDLRELEDAGLAAADVVGRLPARSRAPQSTPWPRARSSSSRSWPSSKVRLPARSRAPQSTPWPRARPSSKVQWP